MKKGTIQIIFLGIVIAAVLLFVFVQKLNTENETTSSTSKSIKKQKVEQKEEKKETTSDTTNNQKQENKASNENTNSTSNTTKNQEQKDGYEIIVSNKNITVEKGSTASFNITFTNPDESSIREYIHCKDQSDIIVVRYSDVINKKINVELEALKVGVTEIEVSDYNYPDKKEIIKVNVVEKN